MRRLIISLAEIAIFIIGLNVSGMAANSGVTNQPYAVQPPANTTPSAPSSGATARPVNPTGGIRAPVGNTFAPLTEGECKQLGGKVGQTATNICRSGKACGTVDQDGVIHTACINK